MRLRMNPVVQFLAVGVLVVVAVVFGTDVLSHHAAESEAVADARAMSEVLAHSVAEPLIPRGLADGSPQSAAEFDPTARNRLLVDDVERIKIWNTDGVIVYSDERPLVGQQFDLDDEELEILAGDRSSDAGVSDLREPENRFEYEPDGLLEVYTRIESPEGDPLLFEVYYSADDMQQATEEILSGFRPITVGALIVLALLTTPLIWALTRRLDRSAKAREKLLRNAVDASEAERRRIARDLHEGVLGDLRDASSALSAEARSAETEPTTAQRLLQVDDSLQRSTQALRSLVLEIYPPRLDAAGLGPALEDLVAPAAAAGITADVDVDDLDGASEDAVALVWRVAREAVRNSIRHARATQITASVRRTPRHLELRVADDGVGFVPGAFAPRGRFGIRALHDLAAEAGGRMEVQSGPGRGTTVTLEVPDRPMVGSRR